MPYYVLVTNVLGQRGNILYQPPATISVYKCYFFPRTINDWKWLPTRVRDWHTLDEFKAALISAAPSPTPAYKSGSRCVNSFKNVNKHILIFPEDGCPDNTIPSRNPVQALEEEKEYRIVMCSAQPRGGGGILIFFFIRRLEPSIYPSPQKISRISSTPKKYLKF